MRSRFLSLALAIAIALSITATPVVAETETAELAATSYTYGELTYEINDDGTITITDCDESAASVEIPDEIDGMSVTSIGSQAFAYCYSLKNVTIPNSVINIGRYAFRYCSGLTNVTIPNSVTNAEFGAFEYCTGLKSISISNSMTSIGANMFYYCYNLKSVLIPNSVTSIGRGAFFYCRDLSDVKIPDSVTVIEYDAFRYCSSLTSIDIPNSVTNIGDDAFNSCSSLSNIKISNNVTHIGDSVFSNCDSLTSIVIPNGIKYINQFLFMGCSNLTSVEIPNSITGIRAAAFYHCSSLSDIYFNGSEDQWNKISIKESFNSDLINATIHFNSTIGGGTQGATNSTSTNAPIITSATGTLNGVTYDLFTQQLSIDKDSDDLLSVEGTVDPNGCGDVRLYISQGADKAIEIPLNACKDIQIGKEFSAGNPIYMVAVDRETGKSTSKRTKLSVASSSMFEGELSSGPIRILDDFGVDVPEEVPVIGGTEVGLSLGSISSEVEIDGNTFKAAIGTDFLNGKTDGDGKWQKEAWTGFKQGFKDAKEAARKGLSGYNYLKNIAPKSTKLEITKGADASVNVTGYLEGYFDESRKMRLSEGGIIVTGEISYTYEGMVLVAFVPLYYEVGAGGELEFVGGVKDLVPGDGLQKAFTGSITPAVFFEVGGGVGVPKIFTVGASGKVKLELEVALDRIYQRLDVIGSASFKLSSLFGTYNKEFANGTFHVYETGNKNTLLGKTVGLAEDTNDIYANINIDAPIKISPHGDGAQTWLGDRSSAQLAADYTNQTLQTLEEGSYEDAAPVFARMDGANVIAWITDNKERADGDKTMLVYSVYKDGVWTSPKAVYDDGLADYSPAMKDGYIVWQKSTANITENTTAREAGAASEIYLAKWNGSGFDSPVRITDNTALDQTPALTVNSGVPTVVWIQNSENDFTCLTGENHIMSYTDGKTTTELKTENVVTYMDCAYMDGALNIAYEIDGDKNLSTLSDRELFSTSGERFTDNELIDTHPVYGEINGKTTLFYYSDGRLVYLQDGEEKVAVDRGVSTDQFTVVSNGASSALLWTTVYDGSAEIHGALYDGVQWSEDVQISNLGQRIKYPSAVMNDDGSIFAVFNKIEKVSDGEDYYVDGRSDLCTINIVPAYNLELTNAYFDESAMKAHATVKNIGELNIDGFEVTITDSDAMTVTDGLKAGESVEIEIAYNTPEYFSARVVELSVAVLDGDEYDTDNNHASFSIGNPDILVSNISTDDNEICLISADISNDGYSAAYGVKVQLREYSAEGNIVQENVIDLEAGADYRAEFSIDKNDFLFYDTEKQFYITAEYGGDEISLGNNDEYIFIISPIGEAYYETEILNYNNISGQCVINSIAVNNTDEDLDCTVYTAVYSCDGMLKYSGTQNASVGAQNDIGVDITIPCAVEESDVIKTYIWDENMQPLSLSKSYPMK